MTSSKEWLESGAYGKTKDFLKVGRKDSFWTLGKINGFSGEQAVVLNL